MNFRTQGHLKDHLKRHLNNKNLKKKEDEADPSKMKTQNLVNQFNINHVI